MYMMIQARLSGRIGLFALQRMKWKLFSVSGYASGFASRLTHMHGMMLQQARSEKSGQPHHSLPTLFLDTHLFLMNFWCVFIVVYVRAKRGGLLLFYNICRLCGRWFKQMQRLCYMWFRRDTGSIMTRYKCLLYTSALSCRHTAGLPSWASASWWGRFESQCIRSKCYKGGE